jgi:hypothetical protein
LFGRIQVFFPIPHHCQWRPPAHYDVMAGRLAILGCCPEPNCRLECQNWVLCHLIGIRRYRNPRRDSRHHNCNSCRRCENWWSQNA